MTVTAEVPTACLVMHELAMEVLEGDSLVGIGNLR